MGFDIIREATAGTENGLVGKGKTEFLAWVIQIALIKNHIHISFCVLVGPLGNIY